MRYDIVLFGIFIGSIITDSSRDSKEERYCSTNMCMYYNKATGMCNLFREHVSINVHTMEENKRCDRCINLTNKMNEKPYTTNDLSFKEINKILNGEYNYSQTSEEETFICDDCGEVRLKEECFVHTYGDNGKNMFRLLCHNCSSIYEETMQNCSKAMVK